MKRSTRKATSSAPSKKASVPKRPATRTKAAANKERAPRDRAATKKIAATGHDEADPRFFPVIEAFARMPGFSIMESKSRATRGLMLHGKSFGMSSHGRLILKLTETRAATLITQGVAAPFEASAGRTIKGWIVVTDEKVDWVALAKEAYALALERL